MGEELRTVSLIFMLVSGGTALFLIMMGLFPFALLMILFFLLFFVVFAVGGRKTASHSGEAKTKAWKEKARKEKKKPQKNARYMRFCSECGYTGSQKVGDEIPACPVCGHPLLATDVSLKQFSSMTDEEREAVRKTWMLLG